MILITGATGLVGSHLILNLLSSNASLEITALYRSENKKKEIEKWLHYKNPNLNIAKINWLQANVNDIPALENAFINVEYVYHCAALVDFDPKEKQTLNKINIEGTANVVNLALQHNVKKLCHVSSIASLGESKTGNTLNEQCDWNPDAYNGDYAISKNGGEMEVWRAIYEGLPAVIVNPGVIIGDGLWQGGSAEIFNQINRGLLFYTKGTTGFVSVTDVVQCMIKLMQSPITAERFVLVESSPSYEQVFSAVAQAINKKKPSVYASKLMTNVAWRLDAVWSWLTAKKRTLTKDAAISSHSISEYENTKIKNTISHEFIPILEYIALVGTEYVKQKKVA